MLLPRGPRVVSLNGKGKALDQTDFTRQILPADEHRPYRAGIGQSRWSQQRDGRSLGGHRGFCAHAQGQRGAGQGDVHALGSRSGRNDPDKVAHCGAALFYPEKFDVPLVRGCAGWMVCKLISEPHNQQEHDLFIGAVLDAWADDIVFDGHWNRFCRSAVAHAPSRGWRPLLRHWRGSDGQILRDGVHGTPIRAGMTRRLVPE